MKLQPTLRRPNFANTIARDLQAAILSGVFPPGSKLPGQRELAAQLETSLPTIREAISILAATGMIEVRHGFGTLIRESSEVDGALKGWLGMAINDQERRDFLEARLLLETHIVSKILASRERIDFGPLHVALEEMRTALGSAMDYLDADLNFHWEMARCAGNTVLVRMLDAIQLPMRQQIDGAIEQHLAETGSLERSFKVHVILVDALRQGDAKTAHQTIQRMINRSAADLKKKDSAIGL